MAYSDPVPGMSSNIQYIPPFKHQVLAADAGEFALDEILFIKIVGVDF